MSHFNVQKRLRKVQKTPIHPKRQFVLQICFLDTVVTDPYVLREEELERVGVFSDFAATFHNISSECINDEHCIRFSLVLVDRPSTVVFSESRSVSTLFFRDSVSMETSEFAFSFSCSSCRVTDYQLFICAVNMTPLSNDRYSVLYAFLFLASLDYRQENRIGFRSDILMSATTLSKHLSAGCVLCPFFLFSPIPSSWMFSMIVNASVFPCPANHSAQLSSSPLSKSN